MLVVSCNCLCFRVAPWLQLDLVSITSEAIGWKSCFFCIIHVIGWKLSCCTIVTRRGGPGGIEA